MPSLLMIIFVIAITTILFFPEIDASSFASSAKEPRPKVIESPNALPRLGIQEDLVDLVDYSEAPLIQSELDSIVKKLSADDPVIKNIAKLRRELAANYEIE